MDLEKLRAIQEAVEKDRRIRAQFGQVQEEIEKRRRIEQALAPVNAVQKELRVLNELGGVSQTLKRLSEMSATPGLTQLQALKFETPEWVSTAQLLANKLRSDIDLIAQSLHIAAKPISDLFRQAEQWNQQLNSIINNQYQNSAIAQALSMGTVWRVEIEKLAKAVQVHRIDAQFPLLAERLFRPSAYFTNYTQSRTAQLNTTEVESEHAIISEALSLVEAEFADGTSLTESLITSDIGIIEPSPSISYNLYEEQEAELVLLVSNEGLTRIESVPSIFDRLRTTELAQMATQVIRLVSVCNQESRSRGGSDVFKLTNAVLEAAADLPLLIVKSKDVLLALVLHLYRLIYEGAGSDKLRFLKEHGGQLERADCEIVWTLKTLRNKLTTHDPEHGEESKIRKGYSELGAALRSLGLDGLPVTKNDYLAIQKKLLSKTTDFLSSLIKKMQT